MTMSPVANVIEIPKGDVCHTLSPAHAPVAAVDPGTRLRIETELNIGDVLHNVGDAFDPSMLKLPYVNGATGPVAIRGATPEHALICRIEEIELVPPGFTALIPGIGAFPDWIRRKEFGVQSRVVDVQDGHVLWDRGLRIPVQPMVGVIGTAPLIDAVSTMDNGPHGGNLDVQEFAPGTTVYLPVNVDGALMFLGDCHAVQGDGELCGCGAIEIRTYTTVQVDLAPKPEQMQWPRFETADAHRGGGVRPSAGGRIPAVGRGADPLDGRELRLLRRRRSAPARTGGRSPMCPGGEPEVHLRHQDRQAVPAAGARRQ